MYDRLTFGVIMVVLSVPIISPAMSHNHYMSDKTTVNRSTKILELHSANINRSWSFFKVTFGGRDCLSCLFGSVKSAQIREVVVDSLGRACQGELVEAKGYKSCVVQGRLEIGLLWCSSI